MRPVRPDSFMGQALYAVALVVLMGALITGVCTR
jgi:hypothetical protein